MDSFAGQHITVVGAARSGLSAASALVSLGAVVLLTDTKSAAQLGAVGMAAIEESGARAALGVSAGAALSGSTDLVITSPGVPRSSDILQTAMRRGIEIWSEVELAYRLAAAPIIAITGTNGKTTTTLLTASILESGGFRPQIAGNISADEVKQTLVDAAMASRHARENAVIVAEISSFQLEWVSRFAPRVAVLTNVTPDHLNRYDNFQEYAATKARLFAAQTETDIAVVNADDPVAAEIGRTSLHARRIWFTARDRAPADEPAVWTRDGYVMAQIDADGPLIAVVPLHSIPSSLPGRHSLENILAASAAALAFGAPYGAIDGALKNFPGVPHRMEQVAVIDGVSYINNSMCTNPAAAVSSIEALDRQAIVIAGGVDKGLDFAPIAPALLKHARALILIGQAARHMEDVFRQAGYASITHAPDLECAVEKAYALARSGEAVLLCPACASFDMFADFEARGAAFRRAVHGLGKGQT